MDKVINIDGKKESYFSNYSDLIPLSKSLSIKELDIDLSCKFVIVNGDTHHNGNYNKAYVGNIVKIISTNNEDNQVVHVIQVLNDETLKDALTIPLYTYNLAYLPN